jgi:YkoY family integral membrane protein
MLETLFGANISTGIFTLLNITLLEILLSLDNSAVLAAIVSDLPKHQQGKALKWGIIGAYILRGACFIFASWLIKILWLKIIGGLYLLWLTFEFFKKSKEGEEQDTVEKDGNWIFWKLKGIFGVFWTTIVLVELLDLSFSLDNIFCIVAFSNNIYLICIGVFIGILAMRFIATAFIKILEKYPFLERITFIVIGILGVKLVLSGVCDYVPNNPISPVLNSHITDICFSIGILLMFLLPIIFSKKQTNESTT